MLQEVEITSLLRNCKCPFCNHISFENVKNGKHFFLLKFTIWHGLLRVALNFGNNSELQLFHISTVISELKLSSSKWRQFYPIHVFQLEVIPLSTFSTGAVLLFPKRVFECIFGGDCCSAPAYSLSFSVKVVWAGFFTSTTSLLVAWWRFSADSSTTQLLLEKFSLKEWSWSWANVAWLAWLAL